MYNLIWSRNELTTQKLGTFGEYYAKMALTSYGMSIYSSEVDDHGIDFVAEIKNQFLKFQVKSVRCGTSYVFVRKEHFDISDNSLYLLLLFLEDGKHPVIYVLPATLWSNKDSKVFVYHAYAKAEYGINLSEKNMKQLEKYTLENVIDTLMS